jgi:hypothetical protein
VLAAARARRKISAAGSKMLKDKLSDSTLGPQILGSEALLVRTPMGRAAAVSRIVVSPPVQQW